MDSCLVRIDITERTIAAAADTPLVAGNLGADTFSLALDAAWEGLDRLLLTFSNAATVRTVDVTENRTGVIPWEVLTQGELRFSLQGYRYEDGDMILRLATRQMERGLPVCSAGCDPGEDPADFSPTLAEQTMAIAQSVRDDANDGKFDGEPGYTPVRGKDYWTEADIAEIKSYVDDAILGGAW